MTTRVQAALLGVGSVIQAVNTQSGTFSSSTTTIPLDNTIPQNTEGSEVLTATITPIASTNRLRIDVVICAGASVANNIVVGLFRDSTANAVAAATEVADGAGSRRIITFTHFVTAGSTAATTFRVRAGLATAGTLNINGDGGGGSLFGGVMSSSITITEIAA